MATTPDLGDGAGARREGARDGPAAAHRRDGPQQPERLGDRRRGTRRSRASAATSGSRTSSAIALFAAERAAGDIRRRWSGNNPRGRDRARRHRGHPEPSRCRHVPQRASFASATTHIQARYVLPDIVRDFSDSSASGRHVPPGDAGADGAHGRHRRSRLRHRHGSATITPTWLEMPCSRWHRAIIVPGARAREARGDRQPDARGARRLPDRDLRVRASPGARGSTGRSTQRALRPERRAHGVRRGLHQDLRAHRARRRHHRPHGHRARTDGDLVALDASHLFESSVTHIGMRRHRTLRPIMHDFIERFAPHLGENHYDGARGRHDRGSMLMPCSRWHRARCPRALRASPGSRAIVR